MKVKQPFIDHIQDSFAPLRQPQDIQLRLPKYRQQIIKKSPRRLEMSACRLLVLFIPINPYSHLSSPHHCVPISPSPLFHSSYTHYSSNPPINIRNILPPVVYMLLHMQMRVRHMDMWVRDVEMVFGFGKCSLLHNG